MKRFNIILLMLIALLFCGIPSYAIKETSIKEDGWNKLSNGKWQYVENGVTATGWRNDIPGWDGWFYFDPSDSTMVTGWKTDIEGWKNKWFYFDVNTGLLAQGWRNNIPGWDGWFYFDPSDSTMVTGWKSDIESWKNKWFYFDVNTGLMAQNWENNILGWEGKWFNFDSITGVMKRGWQMNIPGWGGQRFYFDRTTGVMYVGERVVDGENFVFDSNGVCNNAQERDFIIVLDPGHGADYDGTKYTYDGILVKEKDLNMKISIALRDILQRYKTPDGRNVKVYLTHEIGPSGEETDIDIHDRVKMAKDLDAQLLFSIHCNASSDSSRAYNGSMVLLTSSSYVNPNSRFDEMYYAQDNLAEYVLDKMKDIGLAVSKDPIDPSTTKNENGFLRRVSDNGSVYPNGDVCDWYGIVMFGMEYGIPSIMVEHAYVDNEQDYYNYLSTDEKLESLAEADAKALIDYYGLI